MYDNLITLEGNQKNPFDEKTVQKNYIFNSGSSL